MKICDMSSYNAISDLVADAHRYDEPLVIFDGDDECMVAMRPAVFERMLFDSKLIESCGRTSMCL